MSKEIKSRSVLRTMFTKTLKQLEAELDEEEKDSHQIDALMQLLEEKREKLMTIDEATYNSLVEEDAEQDNLEKELEGCDQYNIKFFKIKARVSSWKNEIVAGESVKDLGNTEQTNKRSFRLPQIQLKTFNGELKDWLPFWSQFRKIDDDNLIDDGDKFQYLLQATVVGSKARDLVESFPAVGENYKKAVTCLKNRYGRDELLVEVYVRELLKLVLQNVISSKKIELSSLYDKLESQLRALETLQVTTDRCAAMLMPLVESCLPEEVLRTWQRSSFYTTCGNQYDSKDEEDVQSVSSNDVTAKYRLDQLMKFLQTELENEQKVQLALSGFDVIDVHTEREKKVKQSSRATSANKPLHTAVGLLTTNKETKCIFCEDGHDSQQCERVKKMSVVERKAILDKNRCCYNCLKKGHRASTCWKKSGCTICKRRHNMMICDSTAPSVNKAHKEVVDKNVQSADDSKTQCSQVLANIEVPCKVILQTFLVKLKTENHERVTRAIIDTASQRSYIVTDVAYEMGYTPIRKEKLQHVLFGGVNTNIIEHEVFNLYVTDMKGNYCCNFEVLGQLSICGTIEPVPKGPWLDELNERDINIEDFQHKPIEILIGADIAGKLFTGSRYELQSGLVAIETKLGWTLMGRVPDSSITKGIAMTVTNMLVKDADVTDLWALDVLGIVDPSEKKKKKELEAEASEHFLRTVTTDDDGRFLVHLPWLKDHPPLPSNYPLALKRLQNTVKRLKLDGVYEEYNAVFNEWLDEEVIEEVTSSDDNETGHYLPHRHVIKLGSTTKIRPVFDASAKMKNCPSLNDCLEKGKNLIELIPLILTRFRMQEIGVVADIRKAFLQISLIDPDREYLKFLWYDQNGEIKIFRHKRVVFGVTSSPFLLASVIQYHLENIAEKCKHGERGYSLHVIEKLMNSFYVDNCITSVKDTQELRTFIDESTSIMELARFDLRGWEYTHQDSDKNNDTSNVLGLIWNRRSDILKVNIESLRSFDRSHVTKRAILSAAHRVFDPIGVTSPVLLLPKILLQQMWTLNIGWDQEVSEDITKVFLKWINELTFLNDLMVPRWLSIPGPAEYSVHVFCDASKTAYATAIYLRTETKSGVNVQLIQAKSRISPMNKRNKGISIPRLELLAANIGVRLYQSIISEIDVPLVETIFWSDSTTVLAWISREEQWDVFVRNRVKEIKDSTLKQQWRYVPGIHNPADLPSRGCSAKKLIESQWWKGPNWLERSKDQWPPCNISFNEEEINCEKKKTITSSSTMMCTVNEDDWYYRYFSKYKQIIRLIAWILRFTKNCKTDKELRISGKLRPDELDEAEVKVLYLVQKDSMINLDNPKITKMNPYMDKDRLIRLKTKITQSNYSADFNCPVVLPNQHHPVVHRMIYEIHCNNHHAGNQTMMSILRNKFWILGGRRGVRSVVRNCMVCKRFVVKNVEVNPPPLPADRVREAKIFEVIGIDFAGPVYLKGKDNTYEKGWICLFTCAVYRAVHLELVSSLSTDKFIQCLRKFISRRGRPKIIYTDNGTNFVGAANALQRLDWEKIQQIHSTDRIRWKFNPPTAAWWGGWWERLIGLMKKLLRRVLGKTSLDFEEMQTLLCECENIINDRPLTQIYEDPEELVPLTPNMFLREIENGDVPDLDVIETTNLNRRMQYRKQLRETLKERFRIEYLGKMVLHSRNIPSHKLKVGDLVLVENENNKRTDWPLARIEELIPGRDGTIRLVKLRSSTGFLSRPVQRIYPLEMNLESVNEEEIVNCQRQEGEVSSHTRYGRLIKLPTRMDL